MTTTPLGGWDPRRAAAWAAIAWACAMALGGCATTQGGSSGDMVTASDETDARKRARIRMELAVGYFEEGKTGIALDEVKQVIALDPNFPDAYNLRGLVYMRLNDNRLAEESFRRAISLNSRDGNSQHNLAWLMCQQGRHAEAQQAFEAAKKSPAYTGMAKTWLAQGVCQARAGQKDDAERSLAHAYELDAGNPIAGYNLANLLYGRGENTRAQFYIRRLNNSQLANAESLWLGMKIERRLGNQLAVRQLGDQLRKRFAQSREAGAYDRGAFDE